MRSRVWLVCLGLASLAMIAFGMIETRQEAHGGAPLVVNSTDDDNDGACEAAPGDCTLREAILAANATTTAEIQFAIPGCPVDCTIEPQSGLPYITGSGTTIDGTTQTGWVSDPIVVLDGSAVGSADGLYLPAPDVLIKGLLVQDFPGTGINADGEAYAGRRVEGNTIRNNFAYGITMNGPNGVIKDNLIEGNGTVGYDGIGAFYGGVDNLLVTGNIIRDSGGWGVGISGNDAVVTDNLVERNRQGIYVQPDSGTTTISGNTSVNNRENGIGVSGGERAIVTDNVVSGNMDNGIRVSLPVGMGGSEIIGNTVEGNGAEGPGKARATPSGDGGPAEGIDISGVGGFVVAGNTITDNTGDGIIVYASDSTIGGESPGDGNTIDGNGLAGIAIPDSGDLRLAEPAGGIEVNEVTILGNSITSNGGLGIDLGHRGVAQNDAGDNDSGVNRGQNYPVLTGASGGVISGTLNTRPEANVRVEFFVNDVCDASGNGEGADFIGFVANKTDLAGDLALSLSINHTDLTGKYVTATATHLGTGDTSEFSACLLVTGTGTPTPTPSATPAGTPTPTATPAPATPTPTPSPTPTGGAELTQGDNQCDDDVDAADALTGLQANAALPYNQQDGCPDIGAEVGVAWLAQPAGDVALFGDVDCDDDVDAVDSLKILQFVAGLPFGQSEPCPDLGISLK